MIKSVPGSGSRFLRQLLDALLGELRAALLDAPLEAKLLACLRVDDHTRNHGS